MDEAHTTAVGAWEGTGRDTPFGAVRCAVRCGHCRAELHRLWPSGGSGGKYLPTTDVAVVFISPGPSQNLG